MDLRNWEHYADTGSPVNGATVEVREAVLTSPNAGTVLASTTTNSDGMWAFLGLSDTPKDIKVIYSGQIWWYKGLSRYSASAVFSTQVWGGALQFPVTRNGGFEGWGSGVGPVAFGASLVRVADLWQAQASGGSTGSVTKEVTIVTPDSAASAKIIFSKVGGGAGAVSYTVPARLMPALRGKDVAFSVQVRQGVTLSTQVYIQDGVGTTLSGTYATTGAFVTMSCTRTIASNATTVIFGIQVSLSDTVYADDAIAEIGTTIPTYVLNPLDAYISEEWVGVDQTFAPVASQNTLQNTLDGIVNRIKAIAGTTNWYDVPASTIAGLLTAVNARVTKAGDTMSGGLSIQSSTGGALLTIWQSGAGFSVAIYNAAQSAFDFFLDHNSLSIGVPTVSTSTVQGTTINGTTDVQIASTSVKSRAIHTGTQLAATISDFAATVAALPAASATGNAATATLAANSSLLGGSTLAQVTNRANQTGTQAASTISDLATAILARTQHTGVQAPATISPQGTGSTLDADKLDGLDSTAFALSGHTHAAGVSIGSGTYTGNNATRTVNSLGFTPKFVSITGSDGTSVSFTGTLAVVVQNAVTTHTATSSLISGGFTITSGMNASGITYDFVAIG